MQDFIENQEFYTNLFKGYAILPEEDVRKNIEQLGTKYKTTSWASFESYLKRMKSTWEESTLSPKRRTWVLESLNVQIKDYIHYQNKLERWPYINEGDRSALERRRHQVANGVFRNFEEEVWKEEKEAKGEVADLRDFAAEIIVAVDAKLQMLDDKLARLSAPAGLATQTRPIKDDVQSKESALVALNSLFRLNFTVKHCDELMRGLLIAPYYNPTTHLSAKIWALLHVLRKEELLRCPAAKAAALVGEHYDYKMAKKPSRAKDNPEYHKAYDELLTQVRKDKTDGKYG